MARKHNADSREEEELDNSAEKREKVKSGTERSRDEDGATGNKKIKRMKHKKIIGIKSKQLKKPGKEDTSESGKKFRDRFKDPNIGERACYKVYKRKKE